MESLQWCDNPHSEFILNSLYEMQQSNYMCDVTLVAENEKIQVHKLVLCAISPYFRSLISSKWRESVNNEIEFQDISFEILNYIVKFIYTGKMEINDTNVYELMSASHLLQISVLKLPISYYLIRSLNTQNCLQALAYAKLYGYEELFCDILKYISGNFTFIVTNDIFLSAPIDIVNHVLCQRSLRLKDICRALSKWLKHNIDICDFSYIDCTVNEYLNMLYSLKDNNPHLLELIDNLEINIKEGSRDKNGKLTQENNLIEKEVLLSIGGSSRGTIWSNVECLINNVGWCMSYPLDSFIPELQIDDTLVATAIAAMSEPRMCSATAQLEDKRRGGTMIYMIGGIGTASSGYALDSCEKYDARKNQWLQMRPLPRPLKSSAAAIVDDILFVIGGMDSQSEVCDETWEYYERDNKWKHGARIQESRHSHGACNVMGSLYIMGGQDAQGRILSSVERYNGDLRSWSYVCEMPEAKCEFGCVAINEYIYVLGGSTKYFVLNSVCRYNTLTDKWERCAEMPVPKSGFGCTVKEDKIYCVGGCNIVHGPLANVEVYNANTNRWTYLQDKLLTQRGFSSAATVKILVDPKIQNL